MNSLKSMESHEFHGIPEIHGFHERRGKSVHGISWKKCPRTLVEKSAPGGSIQGHRRRRLPAGFPSYPLLEEDPLLEDPPPPRLDFMEFMKFREFHGIHEFLEIP